MSYLQNNQCTPLLFCFDSSSFSYGQPSVMHQPETKYTQTLWAPCIDKLKVNVISIKVANKTRSASLFSSSSIVGVNFFNNFFFTLW